MAAANTTVVLGIPVPSTEPVAAYLGRYAIRQRLPRWHLTGMAVAYGLLAKKSGAAMADALAIREPRLLPSLLFS